jgi:ankyrin repeat protein
VDRFSVLHADAGARSKSQRTPLHLACIQRPERRGSTKSLEPSFNRALFVTLLVGYGANVDLKDSKVSPHL